MGRVEHGSQHHLDLSGKPLSPGERRLGAPVCAGCRPPVATRRTAAAGLWLALVLFIGLLSTVTVTPVASAQNFWTDLLTGVEVVIGESVAADVHTEYGAPIRLAPAQQAWVDTIFADVVAQASRKEITYTLSILNTDVVNAFAAPGGYLFITTGLLKHIGNDADALANVLGHEVAHVEHRHGMNGLIRRLGLGLLLGLVFGGSDDDQIWETVAVVATELMHLGWSREQEHESDDLGQQLAAAAGYDPNGMVRFFTVLQGLQGQEVAFLEFLSTHPLTSDRTERARLRAQGLTIAARPSPKPVVSPVSPAPAPAPVPPGQPQTSGGPQVITKGGTAPGNQGSGTPPATALGPTYTDPAGRFSLQLPQGWNPVPSIYYRLTEFAGPGGDYIWVSVVEAKPKETPIAAAQRILNEYGQTFRGLRTEVAPQSVTVSGQAAAYAEYRYTDASGAALREGSYFIVQSGNLYMIQFATPPDHFAARKAQYQNVVPTFRIGPQTEGQVSADTLQRWRTVTISPQGLFSMDISELWANTWTRSADDHDDSQLVEYSELGGNGNMGIYAFDVGYGETSLDMAWEWLEWLEDTQTQLTVIEPIRQRQINQRTAASFTVRWYEDGIYWTQYCTTIMVGGWSYEIAIVYRSDGFNQRRHLFEQWVNSLRFGR